MARPSAERTMASRRRSTIAHPWVGDGRKNVREQTPQRDEDAGDDHATRCDIVIEPLNRVDRQPSKPVPAEDVFNEEGATEDGGEKQTEHGDRRRQRISERVA